MNWVSCKGFIPAYAMTAGYHKRSTMRGASSQKDYMAELRKLARNTFQPAYEKWLFNGRAFMFTAEGKEASKKMASYTGIPEELWIDYFNVDPDAFENLLLPGFQLGRFDARMKVHSGRPGGFGADNYIDQAFKYKMTTYLSNELNYKSKSAYLPMYPGQYAEPWVFGHADRRYRPESLSDLHAILTQEPNFKLLILHGYEDLATPGFQTELDLEEADLKDRIPVKWFEGGHMIYNTEVSRVPLQKTLADFYTSPARDASGALIVNQPADLAPIQ